MLRNLKTLLIILVFAVSFLLTACSNNEKGNLLDEQEAIEIAQKKDSNTDLNWKAILERDKELNLNNKIETYDIWTVSAIYPAGNEIIVQINARTGMVVSLTEVEAE